MLDVLNAHPRDIHIVFQEEGHLYTIYGETGKYISTTSLVHKQFGHFDADKIAESMVRKGRTLDPTHKYYGMTKADILAQWEQTAKEASGEGTKMHLDIENYSNGLVIHNDSIEFQQFLQFRKEFAYLIPFRTEWTVFYEEYHICGSIDMVYYNQNTKGYEIYDWKRSKEIVYDDSYGKSSITEGLEHLPDTNYWHYSLQLNIYKKILEEKYGMNITGLYLICLHPTHSSYERIEVRFMPRETELIFKSRV
jgi:ATP-dependent exoDNAse (exonuclease V) beta subunit